MLQILAVLPIAVQVAPYKLPLEEIAESNSTIMVDYGGAQVIGLRPPKGMRLADACMYGPLAKKFTPSRIMDELTGGGSCCCSYHANTKELGLDFDVDFCFDLYKFGQI